MLVFLEKLKTWGLRPWSLKTSRQKIRHLSIGFMRFIETEIRPLNLLLLSKFFLSDTIPLPHQMTNKSDNLEWAASKDFSSCLQVLVTLEEAGHHPTIPPVSRCWVGQQYCLKIANYRITPALMRQFCWLYALDGAPLSLCEAVSSYMKCRVAGCGCFQCWGTGFPGTFCISVTSGQVINFSAQRGQAATPRNAIS